MTGPRLLAWITLAIIGLVVSIILTSSGGVVETSSTIIRWTARTSLVMFALAYVARPSLQLWRNAFTKTLMAERKWIGLGFAVSHAAHLAAIIALASPDFGAFLRAQPPTNAIAALTFVLLFAMAITSINAVRKKMSPRKWKLLHRTGMHFAWLSFTATYATAAAEVPAYVIPTVILLAIAGVRLAAWMRARAARRAAVV
ncbi:MAG: ferric reductase-like transmembrane domain-containing protein [Deltaproteobacteria bacterium]|nr:ferric reductase-like transmembrane domain-containing protein [Deltaproteobacteria bacterium]